MVVNGPRTATHGVVLDTLPARASPYARSGTGSCRVAAFKHPDPAGVAGQVLRLLQHEPCGWRHWTPRAVRQGGAESVCRGCRRPVGHLVEECVLERYGIPARMAKARWHVEQQKLRLDVNAGLFGPSGRYPPLTWPKVHQWPMRHRLEADITAGRVRLCFGSKRLAQPQTATAVIGPCPSDEFFVLGSQNAGCQLCVAAITLTLRLLCLIACGAAWQVACIGLLTGTGSWRPWGAPSTLSTGVSMVRRRRGPRLCHQLPVQAGREGLFSPTDGCAGAYGGWCNWRGPERRPMLAATACAWRVPPPTQGRSPSSVMQLPASWLTPRKRANLSSSRAGLSGRRRSRGPVAAGC